MATVNLNDTSPAVSPYVHGFRAELGGAPGKAQARFVVGALEVEVRSTTDSVWALIRREGLGGLALRAAHLPMRFDCSVTKSTEDEAARLKLTSALGEHDIVFFTGRDEL